MTGAVAGFGCRVALTAGALALTGCNFFVPVTNGGGGGGASSNLVYVMNALTNTLSGFAVGSKVLTSVPNMPYALGYTPQAAVVSASNTFLYVAGPAAIYAYIIGADGSLTVPTGGAAQVLVVELAMDISPDGNWLFALNGQTTQLDIFAVNKTTGALTPSTSVGYDTTKSGLPKMVKVSPDGTLIFAALGTNGEVVFTFTTSTGVAIRSQALALLTSPTSDNALAVDSTGTRLYIARTGASGGLAAYTIRNDGFLTPVAGSPFAAGAQPSSVAVDGASKYVYVANGNDGTVSGYSVTSGGVATALSGSPYASGASTVSVTMDKSKTYLLAAAAGGSPDLTMYSFDATTLGKLNKVATAATGTDPAGAVLVVATH
jgi:6-phosphogluconolactonase